VVPVVGVGVDFVNGNARSNHVYWIEARTIDNVLEMETGSTKREASHIILIYF
jgi:hypothetical protein